jgi:hypothetical protein
MVDRLSLSTDQIGNTFLQVFADAARAKSDRDARLKQDAVAVAFWIRVVGSRNRFIELSMQHSGLLFLGDNTAYR